MIALAFSNRSSRLYLLFCGTTTSVLTRSKVASRFISFSNSGSGLKLMSLMHTCLYFVLGSSPSCLFLAIASSEGVEESKPKDRENTPSPFILILWPKGIQLCIVDASASKTARMIPMQFIPESTIRHTVCHKHGLNIPFFCGCRNFIVPLQGQTGEDLKYK